MPIYTYRCIYCQRKQELLRPIGNRTKPVSCDECGGPARLIIMGMARTPLKWGDSGKI